MQFNYFCQLKIPLGREKGYCDYYEKDNLCFKLTVFICQAFFHFLFKQGEF